MKLNKEIQGEVSAEHKVEYTDIQSYIRNLTDVFSAATLKREVWLTEREKTFFAALVINFHKGIRDHKSEESDETFREVFGAHKKKERTIYLNKLQDKKWIRYDDDLIQIPPFFSNLFNDPDKQKVSFNIDIDFINKEKEGNEGNIDGQSFAEHDEVTVN